MEGNSKIMAETLKELWPSQADGTVKTELQGIIDRSFEKEVLTQDAKIVLDRIESSQIGKGLFAQALADKLQEKSTFKVPAYIKNAIIWACGGEINE